MANEHGGTSDGREPEDSEELDDDRRHTTQLVRSSEEPPNVDSRLPHESGYSPLFESILNEYVRSMEASEGIAFQFEPSDACLRVIGVAQDSACVESSQTSPFSDPGLSVSVAELPLWTRLRLQDVHVSMPRSSTYEALGPRLIEEWHRQCNHTLCLTALLATAEEPLGWLEMSFCKRTSISENLLTTYRCLVKQMSLILELKQVGQSEKEQAARRAIFDERNRIARDMHDTLAHSYTGILMQLEAATEFLPTRPEIVFDCVARATEAARKGLRASREIILALQETFFEALTDSLPALIAEWDGPNTTRCTYSVNGVPRRLPAGVERQMFRVCQEALSNAQLHAGALSIMVSLSYTPETVSIAVVDDGKGFSATEVVDIGFGISGMSKRAERIGADLYIESRKAEGTTILLTWAIPASVQADRRGAA